MWITLSLNICFRHGFLKSTFQAFYSYIYHVWGKYSLRFRLFYLREESWQRPRWEKAHPVCFRYFTKAHSFVFCNYDYTQIKVDPLPFQTMLYTYLYDQIIKQLWSIFSSYCDHREKNLTKRIAVFDPRGLMWCDRSDHLLLIVIAQNKH